jgi:hypothetical protein
MSKNLCRIQLVAMLISSKKDQGQNLQLLRFAAERCQVSDNPANFGSDSKA